MKLLLASLLALTACAGNDSDPPPDDPPAASCDPEVRAQKLVTVTGTVIDFTTGAPVAGATVDIGTTLDGTAEDCPVEASTTSGADGRFGPLDVELGSLSDPVFVMFRVHGEGRAMTTSDNRTCPDARCSLDHTIASVSEAVGAGWRAELAAGGMANADTRGLIAFEYREPDDAPAEDVVANVNVLDGSGARDLVPGSEVRYVDADRAALLPAAASSTSAAGWAVLAIDESFAFIGGTRAQTSWQPTGCTLEEGTIFLEGRTQGQ